MNKRTIGEIRTEMLDKLDELDNLWVELYGIIGDEPIAMQIISNALDTARENLN